MSARQIAPGVVARFRQELTDLVESAEEGGLDALGFTQFADGLKDVLASAGRHAFVMFVDGQDGPGDLFAHDGKNTGSSRPRRRSGWVS